MIPRSLEEFSDASQQMLGIPLNMSGRGDKRTMNLLAWWGYDYSVEFREYWCALEVGRENNGVLSQVQGEGVAGPTPNGLDCLKGQSAEQIFQCGADTETVSLQRFHAEGGGDGGNAFHEFGFREGAHSEPRVAPCEEWAIWAGFVDAHVLCEERVWVNLLLLLGPPRDVLTIWRGFCDGEPY